MSEIYQMLLREKYLPEIKGLGEIYQIISVEKLQKRLFKKFGSGSLFLSPNVSHGERGLTRAGLSSEVERQGYKIAASGYADSPPWPTNPRFEEGWRSPLLFLTPLAKLTFPFLVTLERFWEGEKRSHIVYVLGTKGIKE